LSYYVKRALDELGDNSPILVDQDLKIVEEVLFLNPIQLRGFLKEQ